MQGQASLIKSACAAFNDKQNISIFHSQIEDLSATSTITYQGTYTAYRYQMVAESMYTCGVRGYPARAWITQLNPLDSLHFSNLGKERLIALLWQFNSL